jgi:hypothetical protein
MKKIIIGNPDEETGEAAIARPSTDGPSSDLTYLMSSKPFFARSNQT